MILLSNEVSWYLGYTVVNHLFKSVCISSLGKLNYIRYLLNPTQFCKNIVPFFKQYNSVSHLRIEEICIGFSISGATMGFESLCSTLSELMITRRGAKEVLGV